MVDAYRSWMGDETNSADRGTASSCRKLLYLLFCAAGLGLAGVQPAQASELLDVACPPETEEPPAAALGTVTRRPRDYVRYWPQTWICEPRMEAVANLWLAQVKLEKDAQTGESYYSIEPSTPSVPSHLPRWHARFAWKLRLNASAEDTSPAMLFVTVEYEQPSLARFDMFVSLTARGVTGRSSRVTDEAASNACLKVRNDCMHAEEIVLEIPRDALRKAARTGLLIDLLGHGRTERLAIGKEIVWAFVERARLR